jgi:hypothetical protein
VPNIWAGEETSFLVPCPFLPVIIHKLEYLILNHIGGKRIREKRVLAHEIPGMSFGA